MHMLANLRARAYSSPGINHSAFVNKRTNVYVRWHHDYSLSKIGAVTRYSVRDNPNTGFLIIGFKFHFVVKNKRPHNNLFHIPNREIKYNCFFNPLISMPNGADRFGYTQ